LRIPPSKEGVLAVGETTNDASPSLDEELKLLSATTRGIRREIRCIECGYGAVSAGPLRCPMCGGDAWDFVEWRPFLRTEPRA
jgi:rubrerythrin